MTNGWKRAAVFSSRAALRRYYGAALACTRHICSTISKVSTSCQRGEWVAASWAALDSGHGIVEAVQGWSMDIDAHLS